jgi:hypothetical protein
MQVAGTAALCATIATENLKDISLDRLRTGTARAAAQTSAGLVKARLLNPWDPHIMRRAPLGMQRGYKAPHLDYAQLLLGGQLSELDELLGNALAVLAWASFDMLDP